MRAHVNGTRAGLLALLVVAALTLASCGAAGSAGGGHEGMDHGSGGHGEHGGKAMGPAVAPEEAGVEVETQVRPGSPAAGEPVELSYRVSDAGSGEAITELPVDHERQMHLIAVSRDLEEFQHIHPEPGPDGDFAVTAEFPKPGTYVLYDEFKRGEQTVLDRRELEVDGAAEGSGEPSLEPDMEPKTVDGLTVSLEVPDEIRAGQEATFTYTVEKEDGAPADDLEPYLGAASHVAIVSEDTRQFAHTHGEDVGGASGEASGSGGHGHEEGHAGHGGEGQTFGPRIAFTHTFEEPGAYKVWAQFNHHGDVVAVPFVVEIA
jgi:hypothetical protein